MYPIYKKAHIYIDLPHNVHIGALCSAISRHSGQTLTLNCDEGGIFISGLCHYKIIPDVLSLLGVIGVHFDDRSSWLI